VRKRYNSWKIRTDNLVTDGGGVRGLSTILILKHIMRGINEFRSVNDKLEPCEVFDMMGGTSTGG
jgi:patatin-like phospholipase/acyl hydrolase